MTTRDQPSAFGHLLKCHRLARGLTQESLAARAGVSVRAVSDLERGINRTPREDTLRLLTEALELRTADRLALTAVARRQEASSFAMLQGRLPAGEEHGDSPTESVPGIDHQAELAAMGHHLAGEGPRVLLLTGGSGSGKSCLWRALPQGALGFGWRVLEGACQRYGRQPYAPLLPALKTYVEAQPPAELRADLRGCAWLARLLPELVGEGLDPLPIQELPVAQERRVIGEAVVRFLTKITGPAGTLLVLDDLQWADPEALELLAVLARSDARRLRMVCACDESGVEAGGPLQILVAELTQAGLAHCLSAEDHAGAVRHDGLAMGGDGEENAEPSPPRSMPPQDHAPNMPSPVTSLIGRAPDVVAVASLLKQDGVRLLTLTGPGGIGKTRLALHVAAHLPDGGFERVLFVPLAPLTDPALVAPMLVQTLGLRETAGQSTLATLVGYLQGRHMLLVLDNFEHLLPASAVVSALLGACPGLKVLVTSRAPLHVQGEHEYPVPPLGWPEPGRPLPTSSAAQYPAVALFVQRASAVKPNFTLTEANVGAVSAICARLDGLPLAIELAAARIKLLPPQALLSALVGAFTYPPLKVLAGGARDLPARLQTMHDAIAWSYHLLTPQAQRLLVRLAVFVGGCALEAAEVVCTANGDVGHLLETLGELVDQSLLRAEEQPEGDVRFVMLETIRQFALDELAASDEESALRERHLAYYVGLVEQAEPDFRGPRQAALLAQGDLEHNNWACAHEVELGLRLASTIWLYWLVRGHLREGRGWLDELLELDRAAGGQRSHASVRAKALYATGMLAWHQGELAQARVLLDESLGSYREVGNRRGVSAVLSSLGATESAQEHLERAAELHEQSLALAREEGDTLRVALDLMTLGNISGRNGDDTSAASYYVESLALFRKLASATDIAITLRNLAEVRYRQGQHEHAVDLLQEALTLVQPTGYTLYIIACLEVLVEIEHAYGRIEQLVRLLGVMDAMFESLGASDHPEKEIECGRIAEQSRISLGEEAFAAAWAAGVAMDTDQATQFARAEIACVRERVMEGSP
jgi:predicted ATPase/transcriptional regulator with XRE-family HTH domain